MELLWISFCIQALWRYQKNNGFEFNHDLIWNKPVIHIGLYPVVSPRVSVWVLKQSLTVKNFESFVWYAEIQTGVVAKYRPFTSFKIQEKNASKFSSFQQTKVSKKKMADVLLVQVIQTLASCPGLGFRQSKRNGKK